MKNISRAAWVCAFATSIAGFMALDAAATQASAQTRAALVQNVDEKGRVPFFKQANTFCNASDSVCSVSLPIPSGQRLVVTHVNAILGSPGSSVSSNLVVYLGTTFYSANYPAGMFLPVAKVAQSAAAGSQYLMNQELTTFADGGSSLVLSYSAIDGTTLGGANVTASVSGYLIPTN